MVAGVKAKLLCSFGGDFVNQHGRSLYVGGKTRLVSIDRSASFRTFISKMSELCDADPRCLDVRFQLPDGGLDSRLVSVENDNDVRNMMEEFDSNRKIPIFLFIDKSEHPDDEIAAVYREPASEADIAETLRLSKLQRDSNCDRGRAAHRPAWSEYFCGIFRKRLCEASASRLKHVG
ncbi:hypothetical protein GW17_00039554 [Ensete ventricosum]|nr:hypothetical protein GW17_00039554 [Ensete ventricosum]RZR93661.1 hypothetical protein BHM03_00022213 [Ensete ventricosum]